MNLESNILDDGWPTFIINGGDLCWMKKVARLIAAARAIDAVLLTY